MKKLIIITLCIIIALGTMCCFGCNPSSSSDDSCHHSWSSWSTISPPTCTSTGYAQRSCSLCGETQEKILKEINHNYVNGRCTICGKIQ